MAGAGKADADALKAVALSTLLQGPSPAELALPPGVAVSPATFATASSNPIAQLPALYGDEDWPLRVFGEREDALIARYSNGDPRLVVRAFELRDVEALFSDVRQDTQPVGGGQAGTYGAPQFNVVVGVDSLFVPFNALAAGGIVQVATHFNGLVCPEGEVLPLSTYGRVRTQGARISMTCAHALLRRFVYPVEAFQNMIPSKKERNRYVQHGCLKWGKTPEKLEEQIMKGGGTDRLQIIAMWALPEMLNSASGDPKTTLSRACLQVFCSAPATNAQGNSGDPEVQREIAEVLVVPQYRAIAQMAVIRSRITRTPVNLHLTLVGGGGLNIDPRVLQRALQLVEQLVAGEAVTVFVHAYDLDRSGTTNPVAKQLGTFANHNVILAKEFLQTTMHTGAGHVRPTDWPPGSFTSDAPFQSSNAQSFQSAASQPIPKPNSSHLKPASAAAPPSFPKGLSLSKWAGGQNQMSEIELLPEQNIQGNVLEPGEMRANFRRDEGPLLDELSKNGYAAYSQGVLTSARQFMAHQRNKKLPNPLNEQEMLAILCYTNTSAYVDLRNAIRDHKAVGKWDRFMTHLIRAIAKLDKEYATGYPRDLFHGLNGVTKLQRFKLGDCVQFNYEGFISTSTDEQIALGFSGIDGCIIQMQLNTTYQQLHSKKPANQQKLASGPPKPFRFLGFVGDVSWISSFPQEEERLVFAIETFPLASTSQSPNQPIRYHVVSGGTVSHISSDLNNLCIELGAGPQGPAGALGPAGGANAAAHDSSVVSMRSQTPQTEPYRTTARRIEFLGEVLRGAAWQNFKSPISVQDPSLSPEHTYADWNWLAELFALTESQLLQTYQQVYGKITLQSFTLAEIDEAYARVRANTRAGSVGNEPLAPVIVKRMDALLLPGARAAAGGLVQIAAQFNGRISPNKARATLANYPYYGGQGPRAVMPCVHTLMLREISEFNAFDLIIPDAKERSRYVRYGFLSWDNSPEKVQAMIAGDRINNLRVLVMWAKPELGADPILQVFTAAAPTNTLENAGDPRVQKEIAARLLVAQYRAIAQMASIRARLIGRIVPLHLTLVGSRAFKNPPDVIAAAMDEAHRILKSENVQVYWHAFDYDNPQSIAHSLLQPIVAAGALVITDREFLAIEKF